jgi:hypothetical protein
LLAQEGGEPGRDGSRRFQLHPKLRHLRGDLGEHTPGPLQFVFQLQNPLDARQIDAILL